MARIVPDYSEITEYVDESLEDDIYDARISVRRSGELHENDNGNEYFNVDFILEEGEQEGRLVGHRIYFNGPMAFTCKNLEEALNLTPPFDTEADLRDRKVRIQTRKSESGGRVYVNVWRIFPAPDAGEGLFS